MQLELRFTTKDSSLPLDYRPFIMSFFKGALNRTYSNVFDEMYSKDNIKPKSFTFSTFFYQPKIVGDKIELPSNKFVVTISSYDYATIMYFYNSLLLRRGKKFNIPLGNVIILTSLNIKESEIIQSNEIKIKFISPLLVRKRENEKDIYLDFTSPNFNNQLNETVVQFLNTLPTKIADNKIVLKPINAKRTVVKNMGLKFNASFGEFVLCGNKEVLNYLLECGIGSRRGEGFGMFKVIKDEK
ncbi:MAG: CRISPR-associated endoribonuclease Cas6 [Christensenellales bacterium]